MKVLPESETGEPSDILENGSYVGFTSRSLNPDRLMQIESREVHNGLVFYRVVGDAGGLYLRSSLYPRAMASPDRGEK